MTVHTNLKSSGQVKKNKHDKKNLKKKNQTLTKHSLESTK